MNIFSNRKVVGALAGTLLTMSLAASGSAAPLSVAAPAVVAPQTQITDAKYVRSHPVVRYYRRTPGIVPAIGGLLAYGLGTVFGPSCPGYYYYGYPYYCGSYYGGPYFRGPYYGGRYYYGPSYYRYGYRPGFGGWRYR